MNCKNLFLVCCGLALTHIPLTQELSLYSEQVLIAQSYHKPLIQELIKSTLGQEAKQETG